tara:strand:+ start:205 stop:426 length:222 start_codon:yes stop_codon:yes gene_type:complete
MKLITENREQIRLQFEALYLDSRKTAQGEPMSKNLGDNFDEIITREGYGYKYSHPDSAWRFFKLGFLTSLDYA